MNYYFGDFLFKSDQLVLIYKQKTVSLRVNEKKLLALLLSDPDKIFSKEAIRDSVWAGKSVAEQSIFQNISNLRTILGIDAIVIHPKKGYQWQLDLEAAPISPLGVKTKNYHYHWAIVIACLVITLQLFFFLIEAHKPQLNKAEFLPVLSAATKNETNDFSDAILTSQVVEVKGEFILSFKLESNVHSWQGQITGAKSKYLGDELNEHLKRVMSSAYFTNKIDNPTHNYAQLQLLQSQYPDDANILHQFTLNALENNLLKEAMLLINDLEKLATNKKSSFYLATTHTLHAKVLLRKKSFKKAMEQLQIAETINVESANKVAIAEIKQQKSAVAFALKDYPKSKAMMLKAIKLFGQEQAHIKQFEALRAIASYANKADQTEDRDIFITQAIALQKRHKLPKKLSESIYFQQAIFAERSNNKASAERFYRKLLSLYKPEDISWYKERAQYHLSIIFIDSNRMNEAVALFANEGELTSKENIILANIYRHWQQRDLAISLAKKAYRSAVLTEDTLPALNAALLLVRLSNMSDDLSPELYTEFIVDNHTPFFVSLNKKSLLALGLDKPLGIVE